MLGSEPGLPRVVGREVRDVDRLLHLIGVADVGSHERAVELARMVLPLNTYTQWYWKVDLHNLLQFLRLRNDAHAQYEIRAYADAMLEAMQRWVPLTHAAFLEYRMNAALISATGLANLRCAPSQ